MPTKAWEVRGYKLLALVLLVVLVWVLVSKHLFHWDNTSTLLLFFCCAVPSVILHEISHGWVALCFGDETAKKAGRLTLNPIAHIDPFGTILLPAMLVLFHYPALAYAKPVPVNIGQLRHPRNQWPLVALAGPATNGVLMLSAALLLRYPMHDWAQAWINTTNLHDGGPPSGFSEWVVQILQLLGWANVLLGLFNLLPFPPLDGSAVLERMLPRAWWPGYLAFRRYSMVLFLIFFLLVLNKAGWYTDLLNDVFGWWDRLALL